MCCNQRTHRSLSELEMRHDGPIPAAELDALKFGSAITAEIIREIANVNAARAAILQYCRSGKRWRAKGNIIMYRANLADARFALGDWRRSRHHLKGLMGEGAGQAMAARVMDQILAVGQ